MYDEQQQLGDGQDNYLQGARKLAEASKKAGAAAGKAAGEAAANAAAATVKAGVEGGKAVSEIAAGTAAGGPWGAALAAAWSLRHTLFKVLVFLCLFLLFIIVTVVSLPSIVTNNMFHLDPNTVDPNGPTELAANFDDLSATVSACIQDGYDAALAQVEQQRPYFCRLRHLLYARGLFRLSGAKGHIQERSSGKASGGQRSDVCCHLRGEGEAGDDLGRGGR